MKLQYVLSAGDVERVMNAKGIAKRVLVYVAVLVVLGVGSVAGGAAAGSSSLAVAGGLCLVVCLVLGFFVWQMPRVQAKTAARLVGATKVDLSNTGIRYAGANVAERIEWASVMFVNQKPEGWVINVRPSGAYVIPQTAVPADQLNAFVTQLAGWAGRKYRVRKR
jgi:YcxB-like protein